MQNSVFMYNNDIKQHDLTFFTLHIWSKSHSWYCW